MKVLLTIGHNHFLLPDDTGVSAVMKTLSKGILVDDRLYKGVIELREPGERNQLALEMKFIPDSTEYQIKGVPVEINKAGRPVRNVREHPTTSGQKQLGC